MQLNRADAPGQTCRIRRSSERTPGLEQTLNDGDQKIAAAEGWLEQPQLMQGLIRRIARKVQNELNDLTAREHGAARLRPSHRHTRDRVRD